MSGHTLCGRAAGLPELARECNLQLELPQVGDWPIVGPLVDGRGGDVEQRGELAVMFEAEGGLYSALGHVHERIKDCLWQDCQAVFVPFVKNRRMDTLPDRFAKALKDSRRNATQVAQLAGISVQSVYNLTSGTTKPETVRAQTLFNLADALQCDAEWLLTGKKSGNGNGSASHLLRPDPAILHEALTLLMYDEDETVGGGKYPPRQQAERLADLYEWVAQDGGRLSAANNARFMEQVTTRRQARGNTEDGRRTLREAG